MTTIIDINNDDLIWGLFKETAEDTSSGDLRCEYCDSESLILQDGDYFCQKCGSLASRVIDTGAEWRNYQGDDCKGTNMMRCGMPVSELMPDAALGSIIGYSGKDSNAVRIMRKYHLWNSMSYRERSLYSIFDNMTLNASNNGIPKSIIEEAKGLYKRISDMKITRGANRNGLIAASIYMSCKNNKVPRSTKEIASFFNVKLPIMTKSCKKFQEMMKTNLVATSAEDFISRYCSKLNIDRNKKDICKKVAKIAEAEDLVNENTPPSIAGAVIYLCSSEFGWDVNKKDLSLACEISQVTITKCYKKLLNHVDILIKPLTSQNS